MARGLALIVGVSQPHRSSGWQADPLSGVDDDCRMMRRFLQDSCRFEVEVLQDRQATRDEVLERIAKAKDSLSKGDFFVFFYSGHGGQRVDTDFDEADRQDEVLLTYDRETSDDDLAKLWKGFKRGVRILTLMDACHSGTMARKATTRGETREMIPSPARPPMVGLPKVKTDEGDAARSSDDDRFAIRASLIHLSASQDSQTAADTSQGGAFTLALLKSMKAPPPGDYDLLHARVQSNLGSRRQLSEIHAYGPNRAVFRKQNPFKLDYLSDDLIVAAEDLLAELESVWGLRDAAVREPTIGSSGIILERPPKHRLDLILDGNSITDVRVKAYVLGLFEGVTPAGPAAAIDEVLGGTIRDLVGRRMFSAKVGEVFILPTGSAPIPAEMVLFVGLGQLDQFLAQPKPIQQFIAGNVTRTLIQIGVDEFATVLIGGGTGQPVGETLANLVTGFVDGLRDVDRGDRARRVILCENDPKRYEEMVQLVYSRARSKSFDDIRLTIYENPPKLDGRGRKGGPEVVADLRSRMFLHVRHQNTGDTASYQATLLSARGKATAISSTRPFDPDERDALLQAVGRRTFNVEEFGAELAELVLSREFIETLAGPAAAGQHLVVVHDPEASKLPWETLLCGERTLALDGGISRKYLLTGDYSIAKWLEKRRFDETLDILLVVNPTEDLEGAEREGEILRKLIKDIPAVKVTEVHGQAATRDRLLTEFRSGAYDVIHYAGHAGFDKNDPGRSGILCSDERVLSGTDLATVGDLPALVFFNACQSGRIRKAARPIKRLQQSVSFAEAFLRGGVANFIGTYWPVGDESAEAFAKTFYRDIVDGQPVGDALIAGRRAVHEIGSFDWADYIHYGDPDFRIKESGKRGEHSNR